MHLFLVCYDPKSDSQSKVDWAVLLDSSLYDNDHSENRVFKSGSNVCHDGDAIKYNGYKLGLFVGNIEVIGYLLDWSRIEPYLSTL